jgi:hypothetical protein
MLAFSRLYGEFAAFGVPKNAVHVAGSTLAPSQMWGLENTSIPASAGCSSPLRFGGRCLKARSRLSLDVTEKVEATAQLPGTVVQARSSAREHSDACGSPFRLRLGGKAAARASRPPPTRTRVASCPLPALAPRAPYRASRMRMVVERSGHRQSLSGSQSRPHHDGFHDKTSDPVLGHGAVRERRWLRRHTRGSAFESAAQASQESVHSIASQYPRPSPSMVGFVEGRASLARDSWGVAQCFTSACS